MNRNPLVTPEWLYEHLQDPGLVVVDCRFDLARPEAGAEAYRKGHIPGALYLDLEKDLSAPVETHGGATPCRRGSGLRSGWVKWGSIATGWSSPTMIREEQWPPASGGCCGFSGMRRCSSSTAATGHGQSRGIR